MTAGSRRSSTRRLSTMTSPARSRTPRPWCAAMAKSAAGSPAPSRASSTRSCRRPSPATGRPGKAMRAPGTSSARRAQKLLADEKGIESALARGLAPVSGNVTLVRDGAVATLTLNRPERRNSLSDAMLTELGGGARRAARRCGDARRHPDGRAARLLRGSGRAARARQDRRGAPAHLPGEQEPVSPALRAGHRRPREPRAGDDRDDQRPRGRRRLGPGAGLRLPLRRGRGAVLDPRGGPGRAARRGLDDALRPLRRPRQGQGDHHGLPPLLGGRGPGHGARDARRAWGGARGRP